MEKKKRAYRNKQGRVKATARRERVVERLEAQLKRGSKPYRMESGERGPDVELTESDIKRIKREIEILRSRI